MHDLDDRVYWQTLLAPNQLISVPYRKIPLISIPRSAAFTEEQYSFNGTYQYSSLSFKLLHFINRAAINIKVPFSGNGFTGWPHLSPDLDFKIVDSCISHEEASHEMLIEKIFRRRGKRMRADK